MKTAKTATTFDEIYARYKQRIYVYCLQFLQNRELAEDVFQEVCVKIYKNEAELGRKENVAGWIFTVARNACLNALRDEKIGQKYVEFVDPEDLSYLPDTMPTLECDVKDYIEWALKQLPVELRETLVLREFQELSYDEIAKITATSLTNVKVRIFRARERMREILAPILLEDEKK